MISTLTAPFTKPKAAKPTQDQPAPTAITEPEPTLPPTFTGPGGHQFTASRRVTVEIISDSDGLDPLQPQQIVLDETGNKYKIISMKHLEGGYYKIELFPLPAEEVAP